MRLVLKTLSHSLWRHCNEAWSSCGMPKPEIPASGIQASPGELKLLYVNTRATWFHRVFMVVAIAIWCLFQTQHNKPSGCHSKPGSSCVLACRIVAGHSWLDREVWMRLRTNQVEPWVSTFAGAHRGERKGNGEGEGRLREQRRTVTSVYLRICEGCVRFGGRGAS